MSSSALITFDIFFIIYQYLSNDDQISLSRVASFKQMSFEVEKHQINIQLKELIKFFTPHEKTLRNITMKKFIRDLKLVITGLTEVHQLKQFQTPLFLLIDYKDEIRDTIDLLKNQQTKDLFSKIMTNLLIGNTTCSKLLDRIDPHFLKHLCDNSRDFDMLYLKMLTKCVNEDVIADDLMNFYIDCYSLSHNKAKIDSVLTMIPSTFQWNLISDLILFLRQVIHNDLIELKKLFTLMNERKLFCNYLLTGCVATRKQQDQIDPELWNLAQKVLICFNNDELEFYLYHHSAQRTKSILLNLPKITKPFTIPSITFLLSEPAENVELLMSMFNISDIIENYDFVTSLNKKSFSTVKHLMKLFQKRKRGNWWFLKS